MLQINIYENAIKRSDNIERFCFADFCPRNKNASSDEQLSASHCDADNCHRGNYKKPLRLAQGLFVITSGAGGGT